MCGRFSPLQTETANESNDKPIASKKIVTISICTELNDKTMKFYNLNTFRNLPGMGVSNRKVFPVTGCLNDKTLA